MQLCNNKIFFLCKAIFSINYSENLVIQHSNALIQRLNSSNLRLSMKHLILSQKMISHFWLSITCFLLGLKLEEFSLTNFSGLG